MLLESKHRAAVGGSARSQGVGAGPHMRVGRVRPVSDDRKPIFFTSQSTVRWPPFRVRLRRRREVRTPPRRRRPASVGIGHASVTATFFDATSATWGQFGSAGRQFVRASIAVPIDAPVFGHRVARSAETRGPIDSNT